MNEQTWQDIATAPEGTLSLFCSMRSDIQLRDAFFVDWLVDGKFCGRHRDLTATHWMPLPDPPGATR